MYRRKKSRNEGKTRTTSRTAPGGASLGHRLREAREKGQYSDVINAPFAPNCAKAPTLLRPATFCQNVRNLRQRCAKTLSQFINTGNTIADAPLHGRIVTVGLSKV